MITSMKVQAQLCPLLSHLILLIHTSVSFNLCPFWDNDLICLEYVTTTVEHYPSQSFQLLDNTNEAQD